MGINLQISLGDIAVAASVIGSTYVFLIALKKIGDFVVGQQSQISGRLDTHAKRLKAHSATIDRQGKQIAGLEGALFGRRVTDHPVPDDVPDESL